MIYLTMPELLRVADRALGGPAPIRDVGLLEAAVARPAASAFGVDAYATVEAKAAALMHSLVRNHALIDGNKRLGLAGAIAFLGVNGRRLALTNDEAYDLVIDVSVGRLDDVDSIVPRLRTTAR